MVVVPSCELELWYYPVNLELWSLLTNLELSFCMRAGTVVTSHEPEW